MSHAAYFDLLRFYADIWCRTHCRVLLAGEEHAVALEEYLFLPVVRQMIAVFADEELRQQRGRGQAMLAHPRGRGREDRCGLPLIDAHILGAHGLEPAKLSGLVIQLPTGFLADPFEALRFSTQPAGRAVGR